MDKPQIANALEAFKDLPFLVKEKIFFNLSEKLEKATKDNDGAKINRIEKGLTRVLVKSWNVTSNKAINAALRTIPKNEKRFSQKNADKLIASLEKSYNGIERKTKTRVEIDIKNIYIINKQSASRKFKKKNKKLFFTGLNLDLTTMKLNHHTYPVKSWDSSKEFKKQAEFGLIDAAAWENLARLENVSIGDHYPKTSKVTVSNSIQKNVIEKGLNNKDASLFLKQDLTAKLGGNVSGALPSSIAKGQASVNAYFEGLNATNVTWARNFSQINQMNYVGITQVIFNAIIDRLTSQVCAQMDGRVFTIEQSLVHQDKVLGAKDVEEVQGVAPFTRNLSAFGVGAGEKLKDAKTSSALAKAGVIVPPLHFRCYDKETEVLTNNGWKLFKNVELGETIFSLNPETLNVEWVDYVKYFEREHNGSMYFLTNNQNSLNMMVTPDHPMVYMKRVDRGNKGRKTEIIKGDIETFLNAGTEAKLYLSSNWKGTEYKTIHVGGGLKFKTEDFCKFMGYYLSDGNTITTGAKNKWYAQISQEDGNWMFKELKGMPFKNVTYNNGKIHIYDDRIGKYCRQFGKAPDKYIIETIKSLSPKYIRIFLDAFNKCDGTLQKASDFKGDNFKKAKIYFTTSDKMASDLGELLIKVGKSCSYHLNKCAGKEVQFRNGKYKINKDLWSILEINSKTRRAKKVKVVEYSGKVYDLELAKNHIMLVIQHLFR